MTYPFVTKFGKEYQRFVDSNTKNQFTTLSDIVVVKSLSNG